jgi:hypothetical protein
MLKIAKLYDNVRRFIQNSIIIESNALIYLDLDHMWYFSNIFFNFAL